MYTQTRNDVAAGHQRPVALAVIVGAVAAWGGIKHGAPLPALGGGLALVAAGAGYLVLNRSRPLPEVVDYEHVRKSFQAVERTTRNPDIEESDVMEAASEADEVEFAKIRPAPGERDEDFIEVQLNGGRMSKSLADAMSDSSFTPLSCHPSSSEYHTVYLVE